jgi:GWxTD domain-containing protein
MKKLLLIVLFAFTILYGQPNRNPNRGVAFGNFQKLIPTVQILPKSSSEISALYLYRIPYDFLVFERNADNFKASSRMLVEVYKDDELVRRDIQDKKISVTDFNLTQSKSLAVEGIIKFDLEADDYIIKGEFSDMQSEKLISLAPINIDGIEYKETGIYNPVVIRLEQSSCNGKNLPLIVNKGGSLPFNSQDYQLIIPVTDTTAETISIELVNNDGNQVIKTISEAYITGISMMECNGKLFIDTNNDIQTTKNFILRNFSQILYEGLLVATVSVGKDGESRDFPIGVKWVNKPISLRNPEFAIEMLQYIEEENVVSELLDADNDEYQIVLHNYWKKYDPTPETEYNELMEEFYSRIDYAAMEFRGISKNNGLSTDRGQVYIRYGQPDSIERSSNNLGYVVETWIYSSPNQKFVFVDQQGTGNFILIEG